MSQQAELSIESFCVVALLGIVLSTNHKHLAHLAGENGHCDDRRRLSQNVRQKHSIFDFHSDGAKVQMRRSSEVASMFTLEPKVVVVLCQWNPWQRGQDAQRSSSRAEQRSPTLYPLSSIRNRSKELSRNMYNKHRLPKSGCAGSQVNKDMIELVWAKCLHSFHHRSLVAYNRSHGRPYREFQESSFQWCHRSMARNTPANLREVAADLEPVS